MNREFKITIKGKFKPFLKGTQKQRAYIKKLLKNNLSWYLDNIEVKI
jgi:hypothetical protein